MYIRFNNPATEGVRSYDHAQGGGNLDASEVFAGKAIDELWKDGIFTRQNGGDPYYEAKLGIGDLLAAFLRLHLSLNSEISLSRTYDWSR